MEEIEYKLKQKNAISVVQAISKLVEIIKQKKCSTKTNGNSKNSSEIIIPELQLLKSKCGVEESTVCITASHGIVSLVENGILPLGGTLSDLMVLLSTAKCYTGITMAIGNLLLIDLRRSLENNKNYKCPFSIQKQQHPLITVLSQNNEIWVDIFNQIQLFTNHYNDKIVINSLELLRPVFFYVMCDPSLKLQNISRRQLWSLLVSRDTASQVKLLIFEIMAWIQVNSKQNCLELCDFLIEMSRFAITSQDTVTCNATVLYLTTIMHQLVKHGCDPSPSITMISELVEVSSTENTHSVLLMILSETVALSPSVYLIEILRLCKKIVLKQSSNLFAIKSIVASILQWLLYPSSLLSDALKLANEIILFTDNNHTYNAQTGYIYRDMYFKYIQFVNPDLDIQIKLCLLAEKWQADNKYLLEWLDETLHSPITVLSKLFTFISAIFINTFENHFINIKALDILLKLIKSDHELASNILVLILYKLSTEQSPEIQNALLKALPLTAVSKQNIPLIINTLETIKNGPAFIKTLSFDLYLRLWSTEIRCFPYLQKMFMEKEDYNYYEFGIAKAHTLKEICVRRPDLHGKDMVTHLSQILNKYGDPKGSIASALAIEGITVLCEAGIVDIISTWKSISLRFTKDKRSIVIKSLCKFLSEFSNLRSNSAENIDVLNNVINKLWYYVSYSESSDVIAAALQALSHFDVEQMTLKQIPDVYRQKLKLPAQYAKTPVDAARKPEDVLPYVPGECWVQLLQNINHDAIEGAGNLLIEWVRNEIVGYKSGVYIVPEGQPEPVNYDILPDKSIVRALGNYLRLVNVPNSKVHFSENVVKQCLRILGESYSKPLPPIDWTFLLELYHKSEEIQRLCINLACKQILISESARKIVENYLSVFAPNTEKDYEMTTIFSNLNYLCKGIAPNVLRPVITNSLTLSYKKVKNDNSDETQTLFYSLVDHIKNALLDTDTHEANRILLSQIIEMITEDMSAEDKVYDKFVECIIETPSKYIERVSSPSVWWETTKDKFEKALQVRCSLAIKNKNTPFVWLNECINLAATIPSVQIYTLKNIIKVFRFHRNHTSIADWILELMGQIQEKLTNEDKNINEITFLCDIFLVAIIVFSGYDCLCCPSEMIAITKEARLILLPNALSNLVSERFGNISLQIMEWLYHMTEICTEIPSIYQMTFYQSLTMLRHEKAFCKSSRWMKYVSVKRPKF